MLVRSKEMVFRDGRRFRVNPATGLTEAFEVPDGSKLSKHFVPAEGAEKVERVVKSFTPPGQASAPTKAKEPSKRELMAQLSAAGVKYNATLSSKALQDLLNAEKKKIAPASVAAPSKETALEPDEKREAGTGDQDVI